MTTVADFIDRLPSEAARYEHLVALRWPGGVVCPRCGSAKAYRLRGGSGRRWVCKEADAHGGTSYNFSALVGTHFENTNIPLAAWFQAIGLMCQSRQGVSVRQIQRALGLGSYRSAWYLCRRARAATSREGRSRGSPERAARAGPVSLHPLRFDQVLRALLAPPRGRGRGGHVARSSL